MNIAFDLESVLVDIMPVFESILWDKYKDELFEKRGFKLETKNNLPWPKMEKLFLLTYRAYDTIPFYKGARSFLRRLFELSDTDPIRIITARPAYLAANYTYRLCDRIGVPYECVIVGTPGSMIPGQPDTDKFNYLNRYKYFVDDRRKTAIELSEKGIYCFMPRRSYNHLEDSDKRALLEPIGELVDLMPRINQFISENH